MIQLVMVLLIGVANAAAKSVPELEATLAKSPNNMRARIELANAYAGRGEADKVIALLNPYTDQLTAQNFLLLAKAYDSKGDHANEVRVLQILKDKDDENYQWHMLLGQAFLKLAAQTKDEQKHKEQITSGIQQLRRTLQLQPKFKLAFDHLLKTLLEQGDHSEARELLMEGITKFGRRPELFSELCRLDAQDGFLVQAVANCGDSIKISPGYPDHYVYLTQALYDQKEEVRAEREIVRAAQRFPKSEFVQWAAGTLFLKRKNYPVAGRYFRAALTAKPGSGRAEFGLAQAMFESGDETGALDHFTRACKRDPATVDTFLAAGGRLKQSGKTALGTKYTQIANSCGQR